MTKRSARWAPFELLRPDQLRQLVDETPVAYWPLGLIEHHGWHLPVGFDGLNARKQCERMAERTGGVVLPIMWWGGEGGHERFRWTFYQPMDAAKAIFENTLHKLADFGFRCIVPLPGHGPWSRILDDVLPRVARAHPEVLIVGAPGVPLHPPGVQFKGDHAARWETAYGLALFPELVDMGALEMAHDEAEAWPRSGPPPQEDRHPLVVFDVSSPQFSQAGEDARRARAEEVQPMLDAVVEHVVGLVQRHLGRK